MYDEPYLETCCRAALHRVVLAGAVGRPGDGADARCLARMAGLGLVCVGGDARVTPTEDGTAWHARRIGR